MVGGHLDLPSWRVDVPLPHSSPGKVNKAEPLGCRGPKYQMPTSLSSHERPQTPRKPLAQNKSPSAEEVPGLGALFLESPKAFFPGQTSRPHAPALQPGSRGWVAKPAQKPEGELGGRQPHESPAEFTLC